MRIVQFIDSMTYGGAESVVCNTACEMKRQGMDVSVMCFSIKRGTAHEDRLKDSGIETVFLAEDCLKALGLGDRRDSKLRFLAQILLSVHFFRKRIKELNPDVLHMHLDGLIFYPFIPAKLRKNMVFFWTSHSKTDEIFKGFIGNLRKIILSAHPEIKIFVLNENDAVAVRNLLPKSDVDVIENGVSFRRFDNAEANRREVREMLNIPADSLVVGHVGRFGKLGEPVKNQGMIVKIFDKIYEKRPDAYLILVGGGELTGELRKQLDEDEHTDRIIVLKDRDDVPRLMQAMDYFVFPSVYEGFPMTMVEAQIAGLKCIVSDAVTKEVALTKDICFLSLKDSIETWAEAVLSFKGADKPEYCLDNYNIENVVRKLYEVYSR